MSQYPQNPQYPEQSPYAPPITNYYAGSTAPKRPASVTSVAVIGTLGLLCGGFGLIANLMALANGGKNPLTPQMPTMDHSLLIFSVFQTIMNFALSLIGLICCIAALSLKPFARKVMMPWSFVTLLWSIVLLFATIGWINPETERVTRATAPPVNGSIAAAQHIGMNIGAVLTCAVVAAVPLCVLTFWTRPRVKAAFGNPEAMAQHAGMQPPPYQYPPNQNPPGKYPPQ